MLWLRVRLGLGQYSGKTELAVRAQRNSQVQTRWIWTPLGLLRGSQAEGRGGRLKERPAEFNAVKLEERFGKPAGEVF